LSEALADYSATLFATHKAQRKSVYLARHARSWKVTLNRSSRYGITVESLGPVVMGSRLNSSHSYTAYQAVVYDKGALVFHMLARAIGPEPFSEMLESLVAAVQNRVIDTATFVGAMERMSGLDLDDFAQRFIYGTGIPEVYYTYRFTPQAEGRWLIEGEARQVASGGDRYTLQRTEAGSWDVSRAYRAALDVARSALVVPFQISLAEAKDEATTVGARSRQKTTTQTGLGGNMVLQGEVTPIRIPLERKPEGFWLDQRGEVLASFYCEQREPKRMLRYRAMEVARAGRHDEAVELYRKALEAPLLTPGATDDPPPKKEEERLSRSQDAATHIGLATIHIERGSDSAAAAALDEADRLLTGLDKDHYAFWRKALRARIAERTGDHAAAYDILGKILYLDFPQRADESLADVARRLRFSSDDRYYGGGDDYALLAAAAWETGHEDIARAAAGEAKKRDADVAALETLMVGIDEGE
jgi:tetratricopeptide (TPR) repeat protein